MSQRSIRHDLRRFVSMWVQPLRRLQKIKVFKKPMIRRAIGATEVGISQSFLAFRRLHPPPLLVYCSRHPGIAQAQPGDPDEPDHPQNPTRPHPPAAPPPRDTHPPHLQTTPPP